MRVWKVVVLGARETGEVAEDRGYLGPLDLARVSVSVIKSS